LLGPGALVAAPTETLLERTAKRVQQFWDEISAVSCMETVSQDKLSLDGRVTLQRKAVFDYLLLMQIAGDDLSVEESRLPRGDQPKPADRALLATSGFAALILIFHPHFQSSYRFVPVYEELGQDAGLMRVRFEHIPGQRSPSVLQLRGREFPIEWKGEAWIDRSSARVVRIIAGLKVPMADVGLETLSSDVRYSPVALKGMKEPAWLPEVATIEVATTRQRWRNVHQFARYREFMVETQEKVEAPKQ
jgi:hypothetical protein